MGNKTKKFRAWDVVKSEMVYHGAFQFEQFPRTGFLAPQEIRQRIFPFDGIESGEMVTTDPLNGWHLMESSGILDKNGNEIYQNDYLKDLLSGVIWLVELGECKKHGFTGWYCKGVNIDGRESALNADYHNENTNTQVEVIGNIYENVEIEKMKCSNN